MSYRLPDDSITDDPDTYVNAWNKLAAKALKVFPGFVVAAYNPDVVLARCETLPNGTTRELDRVTLKVSTIKLMKG